jgi:hypothetical protein
VGPGSPQVRWGEIAAGASLPPKRQLVEEIVYVLDGHGSTAVWNDAGERDTFEWQARSLFAIPLDAWYQHINGSGKKTAQYFALAGSRGAGVVRHSPGPETNFVPDAVNLPLASGGARVSETRLHMGLRSMSVRISQVPAGACDEVRILAAPANTIVLTGEGYTLAWPESGEPQRYDWRAGSLFAIPGGWSHQHFNLGAVPARWLTPEPAPCGAGSIKSLNAKDAKDARNPILK